MINQIPIGPLTLEKTKFGNGITIIFPEKIKIDENLLSEVGKCVYKMLEKMNGKI